jgi:hypothetical protein
MGTRLSDFFKLVPDPSFRIEFLSPFAPYLFIAIGHSDAHHYPGASLDRYAGHRPRRSLDRVLEWENGIFLASATGITQLR